MSTASKSRWDASARRGYNPVASSAWDLRWWIFGAVATSVVVHVGLMVAIQKMGWEINPAASAAEPTTDERFPEVRVQMKPSSMKTLSVQEVTPAEAEQRQIKEISKEVPDMNLLARVLSDDVIITPQATVPTNLDISAAASGEAGQPLEVMDIAKSQTTEAIEKKILASKVDLVLSTKSGGPDQLNIELPEKTAQGLEDFKSPLNATRTKGDNGLGGLGDNYKAVSDLLEYTGPVTDDVKALMPSDLLFDYNSADLRPGARLSLMQLGQLIELKFPTSICYVDGHTDTTGEAAYNEALSLKRAQAVKNWLVQSLRLDPNRIEARGLGESKPLVNPTGTPDEQQLNRRVEISFRKL